MRNAELRSYVGRTLGTGAAPSNAAQSPTKSRLRMRAAKASISAPPSTTHAPPCPALRALSFAERGAALKPSRMRCKASAMCLLDLASRTAAIRSRMPIRCRRRITTLLAYADFASTLGNSLSRGWRRHPLGRSARFHGQHISVPRHGVAVHINAFNFPALGFAEKAAVARSPHAGAQQAGHPLGDWSRTGHAGHRRETCCPMGALSSWWSRRATWCRTGPAGCGGVSPAR